MTRATEPGTILGTIGYMSPEQASGRALDARSDQFSLGSILYEMAAGKRAFERGTKVQTLSAIIDDEPEAVGKVNSKLPANFCWIVERCLAKEPEGRYAATRDLAPGPGDAAGSRLRDLRFRELPIPHPKKKRLSLLGGLLVASAVGAIGASLLLGTRIGEKRGIHGPLPVFRGLTFRRGYLTGARFAPDGHTVVYSAAWEGQPSEIFTTRLDPNLVPSASPRRASWPSLPLARWRSLSVRERLGPLFLELSPPCHSPEVLRAKCWTTSVRRTGLLTGKSSPSSTSWMTSSTRSNTRSAR